MWSLPALMRELTTAPRRLRFYLAPAAYVAGLFLLVCSCWLVLTGAQEVRNLGDVARFGELTFQLIGPLQLLLALFFSAMFTAGGVAHEKDKHTLVLLLATDLTSAELVLGKLLAGLLHAVVLVAASAPLLMLGLLFGGVSPGQVLRVLLVTLATAVVSGSLGSTLALWRDKTFQTLAATVLTLVFWLAISGSVYFGAWGEGWLGAPAEAWSAAFSPWGVLDAARPLPTIGAWFDLSPLVVYGAFCVAATVLLNAIAVWGIRKWNPATEGATRLAPAETSEFSRPLVFDEASETAVTKLRASITLAGAGVTQIDPRQLDNSRLRAPWDWPILWRETRTAAYGRRTLVIRAAYLLLAAAAAWSVHQLAMRPLGYTTSDVAMILAPLAVISLVLINAQAVTSITTERDGKALELLLVTDITPLSFVWGKLAGTLWNTKEMVIAPLAVMAYFGWQTRMPGDDLFSLIMGMLILTAFTAMLGLHVGMAYMSSRTAVSVSLGSIFFLFLGVATCMWIMVKFAGSFQVQLLPFMTMSVGGSLGLYVALGWRNPSQAIGWAAASLPFFTFWGITQFLSQGGNLSVLLGVGAAYWFTTYAMYKPAVAEFDLAIGRTTYAGE